MKTSSATESADLDWSGFANARRCNTEDGALPRMYRHLEDEKDGRFIVHDYLSGSDYSGSLVNVANAQAWGEEFAEGKDLWWTRVYGGHGTFAIVVDTRSAPAEAHAMLCGLEDYPVIDDELHSQLESEATDEAWNDFAREGFIKLIEVTHRIEFSDREALDDAKIRAVFEAARERANAYWINEEGSSSWIDVKPVVKALTAEEILALAQSAPTDIAF